MDSTITDNELFVQPSETLNGVLRFQSLNEGFIRDLKQDGLLDQYDTLTRWEALGDLEFRAGALGITFMLKGDAEERLALIRECISQRFRCGSSWFESHDLYPFQHVGLNLAYRIPRTLVEWDTGAGKTVLSMLLMQRLFEEDQIDRALVLCKKTKLVDWEVFLDRWTDLDVARVDGARRDRHRAYEEGGFDCLVTNYEKLRDPSGKGRLEKKDWRRTDLAELTEWARGRTILVVVDEAQKLGNGQTLLSKGFRHFVRWVEESGGSVRIVMLTATPYTTSPHNIYHIFSAMEPGYLGTKKQFDDFFVQGWQFTKYGMVPEWNHSRLPILGKKIEPRTHTAMKSDPIIAAQFPEMTEREVYIDLSSEDRAVYRDLEAEAKERYDDNDSVGNGGNFNLMRMVCNTVESLNYSQSETAEALRDIYETIGTTLSSRTSEKFRAIGELCETLMDEGEKVVVFSFWANAVLQPFLRYISETIPSLGLDTSTPNILTPSRRLFETQGQGQTRSRHTAPSGRSQSPEPEVSRRFEGQDPRQNQGYLDSTSSYTRTSINPIHVVVGGMKAEDTQRQVDGFNSHDGPALFVASDVAQEGLDLYARYIINIEMPSTYSSYRQRWGRVHRGDSRDRGIEHVFVYRFLTRRTVEERINDLLLTRRSEAESIRGRTDVVSVTESLDRDTMRWLMFGEEEG